MEGNFLQSTTLVAENPGSLGAISGQNTPSVSWLLCTNTASEQLHLAIKSCLEQTFTDFELIIVVNGSNVAEIVKIITDRFGSDSRLRIFQTDVRRLTFSLNLGLHYARSDLIARMDSDDISTSDRLEKQVAFMRKHPDVVVLGTAYDVIDDSGCSLQRIKNPIRDEQIRRALHFGNPLCHPSVMLRRKPIIDSGAYLGAGYFAEDYDLWSRLALDPSIKFANLPDACIGYRATPLGEARRSRLSYASMASSQFRNWILGEGLSWLFAAFLSAMKGFFRSKEPKAETETPSV